MAGPQGWTSDQFLRMVHRYGNQINVPLAIPNFETADYGQGRVWGVLAFRSPDWISFTDVAMSDLGTQQLGDIARLWRGAHRISQQQGFVTGIPTFERGHQGNVSVAGVCRFTNSAAIEWRNVPTADLDGPPNFTQPDAVIRQINRWAVAQGYLGGFPDFEQASPNGRAVMGAYLVKSSAGNAFAHMDVPERDLGATPPQPPPVSLASAPLSYRNDSEYTNVWVGDMTGNGSSITSTKFTCPSTWSVSTVTLTHEGHNTVYGIHPNEERHEFDGQPPTGRWVASITYTGGSPNDPCGVVCVVH